MSRVIVFIYGLISYAVGLGGLVCFILFISSWEFIPFHIDTGTPSSITYAILINVGLIVLFGLQHSIMARTSFKNTWIKVISPAAERSTYVLFTGVIMGLFCLYWQPLHGVLWQVENEVGQIALEIGFIFGWALVVLSSFLINHFELFGLQQVYFNLMNKTEPPPLFMDRFLYKIVRHPLQLGVLIGLWLTPTMSMTHLMLSSVMSIYVFIGLYFEEKDLVKNLGENYSRYKKRVPMIIPFLK